MTPVRRACQGARHQHSDPEAPSASLSANLVTMSLHALSAVFAFVASIKKRLDATAVPHFPVTCALRERINIKNMFGSV